MYKDFSYLAWKEDVPVSDIAQESDQFLEFLGALNNRMKASLAECGSFFLLGERKRWEELELNMTSFPQEELCCVSSCACQPCAFQDCFTCPL